MDIGTVVKKFCRGLDATTKTRELEKLSSHGVTRKLPMCRKLGVSVLVAHPNFSRRRTGTARTAGPCSDEEEAEPRLHVFSSNPRTLGQFLVSDTASPESIAAPHDESSASLLSDKSRHIFSGDDCSPLSLQTIMRQSAVVGILFLPISLALFFGLFFGLLYKGQSVLFAGGYSVGLTTMCIAEIVRHGWPLTRCDILTSVIDTRYCCETRCQEGCREAPPGAPGCAAQISFVENGFRPGECMANSSMCTSIPGQACDGG